MIELLVSVAILVIVSGLVFFNQSGFNNSILVENLAYEISLTIRQAQSYGLQSRELKKGSNLFTIGYGVFFDISPIGGDNSKLILYADVNKNHRYDVGGVDEEIDVLKLTNKNIIEKIQPFKLSSFHSKNQNFFHKSFNSFFENIKAKRSVDF